MAKGDAIHYSGYAREAHDLYATPEWVTEALLRHFRFRGPVWEPCCGAGAISRVLSRNGYDVTSTDIADHGFGTPGIDVRSCAAMPNGCRSVITNPPYGEANAAGGRRSAREMLDFVAHVLNLAGVTRGQVALLVRLQWIAGRRASKILSASPFVAAVVLTKRIRWFDMGARTNAAQHHHAWVVFDYERDVAARPALIFAEPLPQHDTAERQLELEI